jgi:hypothetical protein
MALVRVSAWTGAWTGTQETPSAVWVFMACTRGIVAGQARAAGERGSRGFEPHPPHLCFLIDSRVESWTGS